MEALMEFRPAPKHQILLHGKIAGHPRTARFRRLRGTAGPYPQVRRNSRALCMKLDGNDGIYVVQPDDSPANT